MNPFAAASSSHARGRVAPVVVVAGPGEALLAWDAVVGAAGYRVYYDQTDPTVTLAFDQAAGAGIDNGSATSRLISGLAAGTWYFSVTAYDADGFETDYSAIVSKVVT